MRRFRRRRKKVTWIPPNGTQITLAQVPDFNSTLFQWELTLNANASYSTIQILPFSPFDKPVEGGDVGDAGIGPGGSTLQDVVGNEYLVERIVGNHYGTVISSDSSGQSAVLGVVMALGIFVARADETNQNQPIGPAINYNPFELGNSREPWMFRRTWLLSNHQRTFTDFATNFTGVERAPTTAFLDAPVWTTDYHGLRTGPFFDVKSKRRIRTDERLWGVLGMHLLPILDDAALQGTIGMYAVTDMRILGALRRAKNRSNF